jgi:Bacterial pre-peptidase C-terminal domain
MKVEVKCGTVKPQKSAQSFFLSTPKFRAISSPERISGSFSSIRYIANGFRNLSFVLFLMFAWLSQAEAVDLINGGVISAAISAAGEQDFFTFVANAGESIQVRVADISGGAFLPLIYLYGPNGSYITYNQGQTVAELNNINLAATGTYTVVVSDNSVGNAQTGNYNIYFTKASGANEGGTLGKDSNRSETIDLGDLDSYTLRVSSGAVIQLTVTDTSGGAFLPLIYLYGPNGSYITYNQGQTIATISSTLTVGGTYTVVVSDSSVAKDQTGTYTLQLTGSGITSVDDPTVGTGGGGNPAVVPVPLWALALLGIGLLAVSLKLRRKMAVRFDQAAP